MRSPLVIRRSLGNWLAYSEFTLDCTRILYFSLLFSLTLSNSLSELLSVSDLFWEPRLILGFFEFSQVSPDVAHSLETIWRASLVTSALGLMTRLSFFISFLTGSYLILAIKAIPPVSYADFSVVLFLFIFLLSPGSGRLSVDHLLFSRSRVTPIQDRAAGLTIRSLQVVFVSAYFSAGVSKLTNGGLQWVLPETLSFTILQEHYYQLAADVTHWQIGLGPWLVQFPMGLMVISVAVLILELISPLALFSRRCAPVIVALLALFQVAVFFTMLMKPQKFALAYTAWAPSLILFIQSRISRAS